jgi:hypothetical protein
MSEYLNKTAGREQSSLGKEAEQRRRSEASVAPLVMRRPEFVTQQKLQTMVADSSRVRQLQAWQQVAQNGRRTGLAAQLRATVHPGAGSSAVGTADSPIQRMVNVELMRNDEDKKTIRAKGKAADFKGGTDAGSYGWAGVETYRSYFTVEDDTNRNRDDSPTLNNYFTSPEAGHVLGKQNGGDGSDSWNVFAQDGGTNNSRYKAFENGMRRTLNMYGDDADVVFISYFTGQNIREGEPIADEALSDASSISSDEWSSSSDESSSDESAMST